MVMRNFVTVALVGAGLALLGSACNALLGIDGIEFGDGGGGTSVGGGSGGGAGTGVGGAGATAGHGGGTAGGSPTENCVNGTDDDGDQAVDCADTDCTAYRCVPAPPTDWSGPVVTFVGDGSVSPACALPWVARDLHDGISVPPVSCATCSCDAVVGGVCGTGALTMYDSCGGATLATYSSLADGGCQTFPSLPDTSNGAIAAVVPPTGAGTCAASGGAIVSTPEPTWSELTRLCEGTVGAGCSDGDVCAVAPNDPYGTTTCIYQAGDLPCPSPYDERHVAYGGYDDGRSCDACSCTGPSGGSCPGEVWIYANTGCTAQHDIVPANGSTCIMFTKGSGAIGLRLGSTEPVGASCDPYGGEPQGTASPASPTTVCCAQVGGSGGGGAGGTGGSGGFGGHGGFGGSGGSGGAGGATTTTTATGT